MSWFRPSWAHGEWENLASRENIYLLRLQHKDGTYVGRGAPEIDMFEAQVGGTPPKGHVSMSGQWAPFNEKYVWKNTSDNLIIYNTSLSQLNTYIGGPTQQATSVVVTTDQNCYELGKNPCFSVYGFEVGLHYL